MGDRISIQFRKGNETSVALFHHWMGTELKNQVMTYIKELKERITSSGTYPLDRLEPSIVMLDFVRELTEDMVEVRSGMYLGRDGSDGDNSDNGNWVLDLDTLNWEEE